MVIIAWGWQQVGWLALVALAGFGVYVAVRVVRSMRAAWRGWGGRGQAAEEGSPWDPPPGCLHFDLFRDGTYRHAAHIRQEPVGGRPAMACDYIYSVAHGRDVETRLVRVAVVELPFEAVRLIVRPEGMLDLAARWANVEDIAFESEEFNRHVHVKCQDRKFAYDVVNPRAMEAILASHRPQVIEMAGRYLLVYEGPFPPDTPADPDETDRLLTLARDLVQTLPGYLCDDRPPEHRASW